MKEKISLIIKIAMVLFLAIYLVLLYRADYAKDIPMDEISASMEQVEAVLSLDKQGRNELRRFYQLNDGDTDGFFFYKASSPMSVEEVLILKAPDKGRAETFLSSAQSHLSSQKGIFEGYGTEQMALLNNAVVEMRGNYVYYLCGANAQQMRSRILALIT